MARLPEHCPLCTQRHTGAPMSVHGDPWHWMTCYGPSAGELRRRHDAVADAIARVARQVGAQVQREVTGLDPGSKQRPDVQLAFPSRLLLTDVVVSHTMTTYWITKRGSSAVVREWEKDKKYAGVAARLGAEQMNCSVDTSGGLSNGAMRLARAIGEEGERWSAGTWHSGLIERQLLGSIAVAVQRGNALAMLCGYTRAVSGERVRRSRVRSPGSEE